MGNLISNPVSIYALGGLGEVGKNCYCIEDNKSIIMIDAGVKFPEESMPGVSYVIPEFTHLKDQRDKVKALFITHGHEDHIGGIPFLLQSIYVPVIYAPRLAAVLIKQKLLEMKFKAKVKLVEYDEDSVISIDDMKVSFFHVTHSIPDSYGICVDTTEGRIVTTGDFKIDLTPVDHDFNLSKLMKIGDEGVDLLLADSTNAEIDGYTQSEKSVISAINDIFRTAPSRLIISTFSSNISRIQQIAEAAVRHKRKIVVFGRSMESNIKAARDFGYIHIPDNYLLQPEDLKSLTPSETLILCTGSQGEPMAALSRIANGEHRYIKIAVGDTVVFSSSPIPGNTGPINKIVNKLTRCGATVLENSVLYNLHASGHPAKQELRLMQKIVRPKYFMPVHGEYRMLKLHADIAVETGIPKENTFVLANGDTLELLNHKVREGIHINADSVFIDGSDINGLSTLVIKDRLILSNDGMVTVAVGIDSSTNTLLYKPIIKTKGFSNFTETNSEILSRCQNILYDELSKLLSRHVTFSDIKNTVKALTSQYFYKISHRNPVVIPLIMDKIN